LTFAVELRRIGLIEMTLVLSIAGALYPFQWFDIFSAFVIFALLALIFLLSLSDPALDSDDEP
jgi:hypothetical protein